MLEDDLPDKSVSVPLEQFKPDPVDYEDDELNATQHRLFDDGIIPEEVIGAAEHMGKSYPSSKIVREDPLVKSLPNYPVIYQIIVALVNKNPLEQLFIWEKLSETAKDALRELQKDVAKNEVVSYEEVIEKLKTKIASLETRVATLGEEKEKEEKKCRDLENERILKEKEVKRLDKEISIKNKELDQLKKSGVEEVEKEVSKRREELDEEIKRKEERSKALDEEIKAREELYDKNAQLIAKAIKDEEVVVWEKIPDNDPVFTMGFEQVSLYLREKIDEYAKYMGITRSDSCDEFLKRSPKLADIDRLVRSNNSDTCDIFEVCSLLRTLKLPKYYKRSIDARPTSEIESVEAAKKERYFMTVAMEAVSAKCIAEKQLEKIIEAFTPNLREGVDAQKLIADAMKVEGSDIDTKSVGTK